jgi:ATP adenylyltransferase
MHILYTPWRAVYQDDSGARRDETPEYCPFCLTTDSDDRDMLIVKRYEHSYIMMNRYPYNPGHLLVIPYAHTSNILELPEATLAELMIATRDAMRIIQSAVACQGFNIGMNLGGGVAGGSVPGHVHQHVLPRWTGDTGFMIPLANTKAMSVAPHELYERFIQTTTIA